MMGFVISSEADAAPQLTCDKVNLLGFCHSSHSRKRTAEHQFMYYIKGCPAELKSCQDSMSLSGFGHRIEGED